MNKKESFEAIKEIIEEVKTAMLVTNTDDGKLRSRPMQTAELDDDFSIYFFTSKTSEKVIEIQKDQVVNLAYASPKRSEYLSISGKANTINDREKMKELWKPILKAWYPDGLDDPNLTLLQVIPENAEFWDTSSNKLIQLFEIGKALLTKSRYSGGEHEKVVL